MLEANRVWSVRAGVYNSIKGRDVYYEMGNEGVAYQVKRNRLC